MKYMPMREECLPRSGRRGRDVRRFARVCFYKEAVGVESAEARMEMCVRLRDLRRRFVRPRVRGRALDKREYMRNWEMRECEWLRGSLTGRKLRARCALR